MYGWHVPALLKRMYLLLVFVVTLEYLLCFVCFLSTEIRDFGDKRLRSYSLILDVPLVGCSGRWAVKCSRACYTGFKGGTIGQSGVMFSVKGGIVALTRGWRINVVDFVGGYKPTRFSQEGGLGCPLLAAASLAPIPCPKKKRCACSAWTADDMDGSASEFYFWKFGASAGTFRGRFFSVSIAPPLIISRILSKLRYSCCTMLS